MNLKASSNQTYRNLTNTKYDKYQTTTTKPTPLSDFSHSPNHIHTRVRPNTTRTTQHAEPPPHNHLMGQFREPQIAMPKPLPASRDHMPTTAYNADAQTNPGPGPPDRARAKTWTKVNLNTQRERARKKALDAPNDGSFWDGSVRFARASTSRLAWRLNRRPTYGRDPWRSRKGGRVAIRPGSSTQMHRILIRHWHKWRLI
jgi:hypothetical protein